MARQRRRPGRGVHRHLPRPARRARRAQRLAPRPPGRRRARRRPELALQEQAEGRPAAARRRHPDPRHQRLRVRPRAAHAGLGGLVHDHGAGAHDAAAPRPRPHQGHDHRRHEHRPRGDQLAAGARRRAQGRRHRPAQDPRRPRATWCSPRPTPPRRWSRSCPRSARIGFMADSVRIPTQSVSLIILNVTFQSEALADGTVSVEREAINAIYREAAEGEAEGPAQVHRRAERLRRHARRGRRGRHRGRRDAHAHRLHEPARAAVHPRRPGDAGPVRMPLTHVKVFGWYDNEMGSYTYRLGELTTAPRGACEPVSGAPVGAPDPLDYEGWWAVSPARARSRRRRWLSADLLSGGSRGGGQLLEAQVRVLDAQLGDVAQRAGSAGPPREAMRRAGGGGLALARRRRPTGVGLVAVGQPVGAARAPSPARRAPPSAGTRRARRARRAGRAASAERLL